MAGATTVPQLSVILPVYNSAHYLASAITSVLEQAFSDFELIIINDGSTDNSMDVIRSFNDPRIVVMDQPNMGLAATLNRGISLARAELIARQDHDDISLPSRFERQVNYMHAHGDVALLGTAAVVVDSKGRPTGGHLDHPVASPDLKFSLIFNNPFVHSSVVFRKKAILDVGGYSVSADHFEDHNLWSRVARKFAIANLPDRLLLYRQVHTGMSHSTADYSHKVLSQDVDNFLHYSPNISRGEAGLFIALATGQADPAEYNKRAAWFQDTLEAIAADFCKAESLPAGSIAHIRNDMLLGYRRHRYNAVINDPRSSYLSKSIARLRRKLMFLTNSERLGA